MTVTRPYNTVPCPANGQKHIISEHDDRLRLTWMPCLQIFQKCLV